MRKKLLIGILVILVFMLSIWTGKQLARSNKYPGTPISPTPVQTHIESSFPYTERTGTRSFDLDDAIYNKNFPEEILKLTDSQLNHVSCYTRFYCHDDGCFFHKKPDPGRLPSESIKLEDRQLLESIEKVHGLLENKLDRDFTINICNNVDGKSLFVYGKPIRGAGAGYETYFYESDAINFKKVGMIKSEPIAYFQCSELVAWTTSDKLYYSCGGGDGCCGARSIYRVDLNTGKSYRLLLCQNTADEPIIKCDK